MAELKKLLGFMSSWDREATLDRYEAMFDEDGDPEAVMEKLGSPTKVAVELAQDYVSSPPPGEAVDRDAPEIEVISLEQLLAEEDAGVSLSPAPPPAEAEEAGAPAPAEAEETEPPPPEEEPEAPAAPVGEEPPEQAADKPSGPPAWDPPSPEKPGGAAVAVYWVLAVLIGLPVALALFCLGVPFMAAGVLVLTRTISAVPAMFGSFTLLSDVLLVAGAGLGLLGLGLLLVWFGAWLSLTLCRLWIFRLILPLGRRIRNGKEARET